MADTYWKFQSRRQNRLDELFSKHLNTPSMYKHYIRKKGGKNMGVVLVKNAVTRKPGYLYYVDGKGNVCEAKMARGGKKKKKK